MASARHAAGLVCPLTKVDRTVVRAWYLARRHGSRATLSGDKIAGEVQKRRQEEEEDSCGRVCWVPGKTPYALLRGSRHRMSGWLPSKRRSQVCSTGDVVAEHEDQGGAPRAELSEAPNPLQQQRERTLYPITKLPFTKSTPPRAFRSVASRTDVECRNIKKTKDGNESGKEIWT